MATALSEDIKKAKRLYKLVTEIKVREKEAEALKGYFKDAAGEADRAWLDEKSGVKVTVDHGVQLRVDLDKLRLELGNKIQPFQVESAVTKVSVKKVDIKPAKKERP